MFQLDVPVSGLNICWGEGERKTSTLMTFKALFAGTSFTKGPRMI